ncbi:MAG: OmpA family protein, partial [Bacteroidota bacterium]
ALFGGENVVSFVQTNTEIRPLMKTANYLPELFTIEFDVYFYNKYNEAYTLRLKSVKSIDIRTHRVSMGNYSGSPEVPPKEPGWHHIALSFNKRALKVYFDQDRLLNIPNLKEKPTEFSVSALSHGAKAGDPALLRNIRIAEGGVKLYDRFLTEGKIVTRGILFESGKAVIKPESMGVINEIVALMKDHPEVNFRIEGHTDSDGDDAFNQKLSDERAGAVKTEFVKLGIDALRLQTKGWGESKPVDGNATPEGKANNRRVEFVKM